MFEYFAGQAVAEHALKVADKIGVPVHDPIEERKEQRTIAARPYRGDLGHKIFDTMRAQVARLQVDHAVGRIQQPWIGVPLVDRRREALSARASDSTAEIVLALSILTAVL